MTQPDDKPRRKGDLKAEIIAEWERTSAGSMEVARAIGCNYEYTCLVLRLHRGVEDVRAAQADRRGDAKHIFKCIAAGGFRAFRFSYERRA